ncbi:MAG: hypothetical protein KIT84_41315 [Labilithrix sp.]|nr:hypothetical protein [Labilithrix sp.]MCW5817511.1 hypothetical protein [Labilithrix sp.]
MALSVALVACLDIPGITSPEEDTSAATADAGATSDAGYVGGGCGIEQTTGQQLCVATSMCPSLVVDVHAMPHCGFRVRGGAVDLLCACGASLCSMGVFNTCAQAGNLLENQSEAAVCAQVAEGRCLEAPVTPNAPAEPPVETTTSSSSTSGAPDPCDRQCVKDCGGGAACASVCNCN